MQFFQLFGPKRQASASHKLSLGACTAREGAAHGLYFGFTDASFSALLALASSTPFFFAVLTHGGSVLTLAAQHIGAKLAARTKDTRRALAVCCALQALLLCTLIVPFTYLDHVGAGFSTLICAVSLLSLFVGNLASPNWHFAWASSFHGAARRAIVTSRNHRFTLFTFVSVLVSAAVLATFSTKSALIILLSFAAAGKAYSAFGLLRGAPFPVLASAREERTPAASDSSIRFFLPFAFLYFGIGMSIALLMPFLIKFHGITPTQVFSLGLIQIAGQLLISSYFCRAHEQLSNHRSFAVVLILYSTMTVLWCVTDSLYCWYALFLVNGVATGALSLLNQYLIQSPSNPRMVAKSLSNLVTQTTLLQTAGGICGGFLLTALPFADADCYVLVFLFSAIVRGLTLISGHSAVTQIIEPRAEEFTIDAREAA